MATIEDIMADLDIIYTGEQPNDGTGDSIYTAFTKVNKNFETIQGLLGTSAFSFLRLTEAPTAFTASNTTSGRVTVLGINDAGDKIVNKSMTAGYGIRLDLDNDRIVIGVGALGTTSTAIGSDIDGLGLFNLTNINPAAPLNDYDAVSRRWVYEHFVSRDGHQFTGTYTTPYYSSSTIWANIPLIPAPQHSSHIVNRAYADTKLSKAGTNDPLGSTMGVMTGPMQSQNITPAASNLYDLGAAGNRYSRVYSNNFYGTFNGPIGNSTSTNTANYLVQRDSLGNFSASIINAIATQAKYADLAEKYTSDAEYEPGTVLIFGGAQEVTIARDYQDTRIAGVVSTKPAYLMNSECNGVEVALQGRVPVKVVGTIRKGDLLVASGAPGVATVGVNPKVGSVIGKAIENYDSQRVGFIEAVVGRV